MKSWATPFQYVGGVASSIARNIHDAWLWTYPLERRKTAWRRAFATFDQAASKYAAGLLVTLLGLDLATDGEDIDVVEIGRAAVNLEMDVWLSILGGALVVGGLAAMKAWRKWARRPDPDDTPKSRGGPR